ncbi:unnamed protein product [Closterium sp. NIES-64]|nr:unnamed protein product [Closterium sp. NIES-64]
MTSGHARLWLPHRADADSGANTLSAMHRIVQTLIVVLTPSVPCTTMATALCMTLSRGVEPDERVTVAMNEINRSAFGRRTQEKVEAEKILQVKNAPLTLSPHTPLSAPSLSFPTPLSFPLPMQPSAFGRRPRRRPESEKILQVKKAEGDAEAKYLAGVARHPLITLSTTLDLPLNPDTHLHSWQAIVDGLQESVIGFSSQAPYTPWQLFNPFPHSPQTTFPSTISTFMAGHCGCGAEERDG